MATEGDLSEKQIDAVRSIARLGESVDIETFHFFRMNMGAMVYVKNATDWTAVKVNATQIKSLGLPTYFLIDAKTPLPDSVPLAYLTATEKAKKVRPRKKMLRWIENLITNPDWFGSKETIDKAAPKLIENYTAFNAVDDVEDEHLMKRLELAEKLLVQVAGIGKDAFEQLRTLPRPLRRT